LKFLPKKIFIKKTFLDPALTSVLQVPATFWVLASTLARMDSLAVSSQN